jgi:hypothetical protein
LVPAICKKRNKLSSKHKEHLLLFLLQNSHHKVWRSITTSRYYGTAIYINKWTHHCRDKQGHEVRLQSIDMTYHTLCHIIKIRMWLYGIQICPTKLLYSVSVDWNAYCSSEPKIYVSKQIQQPNNATIRNVSTPESLKNCVYVIWICRCIYM